MTVFYKSIRFDTQVTDPYMVGKDPLCPRRDVFAASKDCSISRDGDVVRLQSGDNIIEIPWSKVASAMVDNSEIIAAVNEMFAGLEKAGIPTETKRAAPTAKGKSK